jgi:hypothetical protein
MNMIAYEKFGMGSSRIPERVFASMFIFVDENCDFVAGTVARISTEMGVEDPLSLSLGQIDRYLRTHPEMLEHKVDQIHAQDSRPIEMPINHQDIQKVKRPESPEPPDRPRGPRHTGAGRPAGADAPPRRAEVAGPSTGGRDGAN